MKTNTTFKLLALAVGLSLAGFAQASAQPLPKDLPAYGPEKPLPTPQIQQRTLPNGLTVWVVPREGLPKVNVELAVLGGTAADDPNTPAISAMVARLLDEGTATLSSRQIAEKLQSIGGDYGADSDADAITIRASALASHAPELFALVADTALHPSFPAKEVALAQANAMQELKVQESSPACQAQRAFDHAALGSYPYSLDSLNEASVQAARADTLRALHDARFQPGRAMLLIVGRIDAG